MSKRSSGPKTAAELMAELQADPEYVARQRQRDAELQRKTAAWRQAEAPLVEELRAAGFEVESAWDLVTRRRDLWLPLGVEDRALLAPCEADRMAGVIVPGTRFDVVEGRTRVGAGAVRDGLAVRD
jgi:hypothetical protein